MKGQVFILKLMKTKMHIFHIFLVKAGITIFFFKF